MSTLERLLISDGDSRTAIDPDTGASKYLVPLGVADERLLSFASTTASPLSAAGLAAAAAADAAWRGPEEAAEEVGSRLRELLGLSSAVEVLLCASGTDGQLLALERAGAARVAVACAEESGSGAECAAQGLHFDGPLKGQPARGRSGPRPARLLRRGQPWESGEAEKEDEDEWLFAMECSKLASRSPLPAARRRLLVDACQLRLGRSRLAALLERGCLVVGTLSKFFCAPAFCGFVLLPPGLPPPSPPLPPPPPPMGRGLWLRFAVGLGVMADYYSLPAARRAQMLDLFVAAARARLVRSPACQLLEPEQQHLLTAAEGQEGWPGDNEEFATCSIVAFRVVRGGRALGPGEAAVLHRRLAQEHGVLLGQPVSLPDGAAALRLSCDARWVLRLATAPNPSALLETALACVDLIR